MTNLSEIQMTIEMRTLGQTGIPITPIGLGVMQFSGGAGVFRFMFEDLDQPKMDTIVKAALDGGINWFDTAEMYGRGRSEQSLARGLKAAGVANGQVVIGTKWFPILRTARNIPRTIADRIRWLDGYSIDLYMIHQPYSFSSPEAEMDAMADLVEAGKIKSVGVSNFNVEQMRRAHAALAKRNIPLAVNQVEYSLLKRNIETSGVLDAARDLGVTIVAWGPLASGLLTGKFHKSAERLAQAPTGRRRMMQRGLARSQPVVTVLEQIAARYELTPTHIALNWLIHTQGETVVAIPGASKVHHAVQAAEAMKFQLTGEELAELDRVSSAFK